MKEFKITAEQIKENKDLTLKEYFKEVFETKLEVGKWYKFKEKPNQIAFFETDKNGVKGITGYGVDYKDRWCFNTSWTFINHPLDWELATEQEVFDALKKEAEKRGYKKGVRFISVANKVKTTLDKDIEYDIKFNCLFVGKRDFTGVIFENGIWAEIISQPEEIIELNGVKYKRID